MKKIKEYIQEHRFTKDYKVFVACVFYSALVFYPFLTGRQRVHDSYLVEMYAGYRFMINGLFNQGRVISSWFYRVLLFFNPPYTLAMAVSVGASLVFLSMAAYIVFCLVRRYGDVTSRNAYVLAALGALMIFFNVFLLETMLFFENAVMSFGILMAVAAVALALWGGVKGYVLSLICMVISVFCYQPATAFFPPLIALFGGAASNVEITFGSKVVRFMKYAVPAAVVYIVALLSNVIFLQVIPGGDGRFYGETRIFDNISHSITASRYFLQNNWGFLPNYVFSLFLLIFVVALAIYTLRKKNYFALASCVIAFLLIFVASFVILLPMATDRWYIFPRSGVALAGIGGLIIVAIALYAKRINRAVLIAAALFVLIISQRQIDIQINSYANQHLDMMELNVIANKLRDYEEHYGITIQRIYIGYDTPMVWFRSQLNNYNDLTISMWHVSWMPGPFLSYQLGRPFTVLHMTPYDMERIASYRQAHWFTGGRMVFDGETVYLILNNVMW